MIIRTFLLFARFSYSMGITVGYHSQTNVNTKMKYHWKHSRGEVCEGTDLSCWRFFSICKTSFKKAPCLHLEYLSFNQNYCLVNSDFIFIYFNPYLYWQMLFYSKSIFFYLESMSVISTLTIIRVIRVD